MIGQIYPSLQCDKDLGSSMPSMRIITLLLDQLHVTVCKVIALLPPPLQLLYYTTANSNSNPRSSTVLNSPHPSHHGLVPFSLTGFPKEVTVSTVTGLFLSYNHSA